MGWERKDFWEIYDEKCRCEGVVKGLGKKGLPGLVEFFDLVMKSPFSCSNSSNLLNLPE